MVYAYLVWCPETKEALLIDPAGDEEELVERLAEKELTLKYIVNTHGHADHTCGNDTIKNLTGAEIIMHEADSELVKLPEVQAMFQQMGYDSIPPADIAVKEGDTITVGKVNLTVIHTPGHTPGGICLLGGGQVFTGDTLFVGSIGRTDLPGADQDQFFMSILQKLVPLPDDTVVWPGHNYAPEKSSTIGREKETNPFVRQLVDFVKSQQQENGPM